MTNMFMENDIVEDKRTCGNCKFLTGLKSLDDRNKYSICGCGLSGNILTTKTTACNKYKSYIENKINNNL